MWGFIVWLVICIAYFLFYKKQKTETQSMQQFPVPNEIASKSVSENNIIKHDRDNQKDKHITVSTKFSLLKESFTGIDEKEIADYTKAYEQIMKTVDWTVQDKADLFPKLLWHFCHGHSVRDSELLIYETVGGNWDWNWLNQSITRFQEYGKLPYLLDKMPTLANPTTLDEAVSFLTVAQLKVCLKGKNIAHHGKRNEIEKAVLAHCTFDDIQEILHQRLNELNTKQTQRIARYKCKLLAHALAMRAYALRDLRQARQDKRMARAGEKYVVYLSTVGDQYDDVERWAIQDIKQISNQYCPPFYVGDRTTVVCHYIRTNRQNEPIDGVIISLR
ncbi:hypothetical protein QG083_05495 [Kingella kingae]|uniref:hypothetical protein n=1 Tax=Kingella kingae TaxID=504 RepID=UPI000428809D|nr:hypothetical protein [Kingella kingae]MDK4527223.1 hypothetical protein [Kingella kingae]MDK4533315.1 hypothetical protein [Kingella kingae]MDK4612640.1 hypothetical protein [Kingella kingae]